MIYKKVEEVPVWKKSHEAVLLIYKATDSFPKREMFGLTSQLRRSASSIPANIAEGFYRNSTKELMQFIYNARGSCGETIYHLLLAKDLKLIKEKEYLYLIDLYNEIGKQLNGWIKSLRKKIN
jgi:four helix bundle protein